MFFINMECLVNALLYIALVTSLLFVNTTRRSYRLAVFVKKQNGMYCLSKAILASLVRGRRSRNKVSVGEPTEGFSQNAAVKFRSLSYEI